MNSKVTIIAALILSLGATSSFAFEETKEEVITRLEAFIKSPKSSMHYRGEGSPDSASFRYGECYFLGTYAGIFRFGFSLEIPNLRIDEFAHAAASRRHENGPVSKKIIKAKARVMFDALKDGHCEL